LNCELEIARALQQGLIPQALLALRINALIFDASTADRYATFFSSEYDTSTRKLTYVNAGRNRPLVLRNSDAGMDIKRLDRGGPVIGLLRDPQYQHSYFLSIRAM